MDAIIPPRNFTQKESSFRMPVAAGFMPAFKYRQKNSLMVLERGHKARGYELTQHASQAVQPGVVYFLQTPGRMLDSPPHKLKKTKTASAHSVGDLPVGR